MALVQLYSGDWFPEENLPVRNGQRYDPTAPSGGGATSRAQEPAAESGPSADTRLWVRGANGKIDTGLADGSDPRQFNSVEEMRAFMRQNNETADQEFDNSNQALEAVRQYTGNPNYQGFGPGYEAPTPQPGSPAARGVPYAEFNATANVGRGPGSGLNDRGTPTGQTPNVGFVDPTGGAELPEDAQDILRILGQFGLDRSLQNQPLVEQGLMDREHQIAQQKNTAAQRDQLIDLLTSGRDGSPGFLAPLQTFLANANKAEGLPPDVLSALRSEATSGINRQYEGAAQGLRTDLLRRGAFGGDTPASSGDILRGFGPLSAARADATSAANRNVILANEEMKQRQLERNQQNALSAAQQMLGGIGTFGNIYDPIPYASAGNAALGTAVNAYSAGQPFLNSSITAAGGIADLEPGSFKNILLTNLLANSGGIYDAATGKPAGTTGGGVIPTLISAGRDIYNTIRNRNNRNSTTGVPRDLPNIDPTNPRGNAFFF